MRSRDIARLEYAIDLASHALMLADRADKAMKAGLITGGQLHEISCACLDLNAEAEQILHDVRAISLEMAA